MLNSATGYTKVKCHIPQHYALAYLKLFLDGCSFVFYRRGASPSNSTVILHRVPARNGRAPTSGKLLP